MKPTAASALALWLLAVAGCQRSGATPFESTDALHTTEGALALSNLDALVAGREAMVARDPRWASERVVLVDLLQTRAQLLGRLEDYDRAEAVAEGAVTQAPRLPESWLARASSRIALHRFRDALADLEEARRLGADGDALEALRASALVAEGRADEALPLRRHLVQRWASTSNLSALAVAEMAAGDVSQASAHLDQAVSAYHDVAPFPLAFIDFQRALMAEEAGNLALACARYRAVLRRLPQHLQAAVHLGALELSLGRADAAGGVLAPFASVEEPEVMAVRADVLERTAHLAEAEALRQRVEQRYRGLVARHPAAFADHAARFLLRRDATQALALARLNLGARRTPAAYDLALAAAQAAGDERLLCQLAREAQRLPHPTARLLLLTSQGLGACPPRALPALAGAPAP